MPRASYRRRQPVRITYKFDAKAVVRCRGCFDTTGWKTSSPWATACAVRGEAQAVTETKQLQQDYWRAFRDVLLERKSALKPQKAHPQHWLNVAIGRSNFKLSATVNTPGERIAVDLYIDGANAKRYFKRLEADKAVIEKTVGSPLVWMELPDKEASRIVLVRPNSSIKDPALWPEQHSWLADHLERFNSAFRARIQALPTAYEGDDEDAG